MIATACTFAVIHINGYVGVLDCKNLSEIYVTKRTGGKIRTQLQQDIYELNIEDPDRIISGMTEDNKIRKSVYHRKKAEDEHVTADPNLDEEDPDRII